MSKHEQRWIADGTASAAELPAVLTEIRDVTRKESLIRFLAAGDDWQAAGHRLSGAFADSEAIIFRREKEE